MLRRNGAFDNSLILVVGDHGRGGISQLYTNPSGSERNAFLNKTAIGKDFQKDKSRGIPLVLVKRLHAKHELKTSYNPVSLIDIPATVFSELGIKAEIPSALDNKIEFPGISMFDLTEESPRTRYFAAFGWNGKKSNFVNPITLYRVEGNSWLDDSWYLETILAAPPIKPQN